jgi:uncharacterized protein YkwD
MNNTIANLLLLLEALTKLLSLLAKNPTLPPEVKANAIRFSQEGIKLAQEAVANFELNTRSQEHFRIVPKPLYDLYSLERTINTLINEERKKQGLKPLELDETLSRVARRHSEDQASTNYLTTDMQKPCSYPMIRHEGLTSAGFTLADRLDSANVRFRRAAENIVILPTAKNLIYRAPASIICPNITLQPIPKVGSEEEKQKVVRANIAATANVLATIPTVEWINREWEDLDTISKRAVTGWMESDGHRANILNGYYQLTGIGAAEVNKYIIITQIFVEPVRGR